MRVKIESQYTGAVVKKRSDKGKNTVMHIHILGICGTFMGSLALLAREMGHKVTGCDKNVYPPMSTQLQEAGVEIIEGFDAQQLALTPDLFVIGNVVSRGNPLMEAILSAQLPYTSGPQWLSENLLRTKWVLAVAGTHGKTTTSTMLAWILEYAGYQPGFLIGGVPNNFEQSARLGDSDFFVIEADEYDTAFFDKRSKFVHYHPNTLILNNLEYDHADIFEDLGAIQKQFHHLVRLVPREGLVIYPQREANLADVIDKGCWSAIQEIGTQWQLVSKNSQGTEFSFAFTGNDNGALPPDDFFSVSWTLTGDHNIANALAAIAAARHVGVPPQVSAEALGQFRSVKRRMELIGEPRGIRLYDDFAHHPTAIEATLKGLRASIGSKMIIAIIEPRSNTMKMGVHHDTLVASAEQADQVLWFQPANLSWSLTDAVNDQPKQRVFDSIESIINCVASLTEVVEQPENVEIVVMSNGGFGGLHVKLNTALQSLSEQTN